MVEHSVSGYDCGFPIKMIPDWILWVGNFQSQQSKSYLGPGEIESFSSRAFNWSKKNGTYWHVVLTTHFFVLFLWDIAVSDFCLLETLREKCPNTEFFLVRIFPYLDWIRENTNQKKLRIWTLFTQWNF